MRRRLVPSLLVVVFSFIAVTLYVLRETGDVSHPYSILFYLDTLFIALNLVYASTTASRLSKSWGLLKFYAMFGGCVILVVVIQDRLIVPLYLAGGENIKVFVVIILHPALRFLVNKFNKQFVLTGVKELYESQGFVVHVPWAGPLLQTVALSLPARLFLFGVKDLADQLSAAVLIGFVEIVQRLLRPFSSYLWHRITGHTHKQSLSKNAKHNRNELEDQMMYVDMIVEYVAILYAVFFYLFIQVIRQGNTDGWFIGQLLISVVIQLLVNFIVDVYCCFMEDYCYGRRYRVSFPKLPQFKEFVTVMLVVCLVVVFQNTTSCFSLAVSSR